MQKVSEKTGRAYCFQPGYLCALNGKKIVLLGRHQYECSAPAEVEGASLRIPAKDIAKIVPGFTFEDGDAMTDLAAVLGEEAVSCGPLTLVSLDGEPHAVAKPQVRQTQLYLSEKHLGDLFKTRWYPEVGRLNSYRLYVPSGWSSLKEKKMIMILHGAGGNDCDPFDRTEGRLQRLAEKRGYLIFAPNSFVIRSNFGGNIPPSTQFPSKRFKDADGNPSWYPIEQLEENQLGESMLMELFREVVAEYGVDPDKIFLMGNSMGGIGTFWLGGKYPEFFRALFPAGGLPEPKEVDWSAYGDKPILFTAGTEDHNGFEQMVKDYTYIAAQGVNIELNPVGGGVHSYAWTFELERVFDTCDQLCGK